MIGIKSIRPRAFEEKHFGAKPLRLGVRPHPLKILSLHLLKGPEFRTKGIPKPTSALKAPKL